MTQQKSQPTTTTTTTTTETENANTKTDDHDHDENDHATTTTTHTTATAMDCAQANEIAKRVQVSNPHPMVQMELDNEMPTHGVAGSETNAMASNAHPRVQNGNVSLSSEPLAP